MIYVSVPSIQSNYFTYITKVILKDYLGMNYSITTNSQNYWHITSNSSVIDIKFPNYYTKDGSIDGKCYSYKSHKQIIEKYPVENYKVKLPFLFDRHSLSQTGDTVELDYDPMYTIFYVLNGVEEAVCELRDDHNRFSCGLSFLGETNLIERNIVDEYIEFIEYILLSCLNLKSKRCKSYNLQLSHDVDIPFYTNSKWFTKSLVKSSLGYADVPSLYSLIKARLMSNYDPCCDPYYTFDFMVETALAKQIDTKYYVMAGGSTKFDDYYNLSEVRIKNLMNMLISSGAGFGIHGSYNSYNSPDLLQLERERLETFLNSDIDSGRQHYLRYDAAQSVSCHSHIDLKFDSTLGFADRVGFRRGTATPFELYDLVNDRPSGVYEIPLIAMEVSLFEYMGKNLREAQDLLQKLKSNIERFGGTFSLLWHNDRLVSDVQRRNYLEVLEVLQ